MSENKKQSNFIKQLTILKQQQIRLSKLRAQRLEILNERRATDEPRSRSAIASLGSLDSEINHLEACLSSYITRQTRQS